MIQRSKIIRLIAIAVFTCAFNLSNGQNIGINSTGASANASALLDVDASPANNKGVLIPRIPLTALNAAAPVTSPALSLLVYNTASAGSGTNAVSPGYYYWDGAIWQRLQLAVPGNSATAWSTTGNTGSNPATNFIGTTDGQDFAIRTNNTEKMRVTNSGSVGIATSTPSNVLDVNGSISYREGSALTLIAGSNNNVTLGSYSHYRITGPASNYTVTGFAGGTDGRLLTIINTTSLSLTLSNNNVASTASNQILTLTGSDLVTPAGPNAINLQYNATLARWLVVGGQNFTTNSSGSGSSSNTLVYTCDGF